jgi:hypothetical protein
MQYRYATRSPSGSELIKTAYLLTIIEVVPVVGLEPTRLFEGAI